MQRGAIGVRAGSEGCCRVLAGTGQRTMWAASYTSRASCRCQAAAYAATPCNAHCTRAKLQRTASHCLRCHSATLRRGVAVKRTGKGLLVNSPRCRPMATDTGAGRAAVTFLDCGLPPQVLRDAWWHGGSGARWHACAAHAATAGGARSDRCAPASDAGKPRTTARPTDSLPSRPARTAARRLVSSTRARQMAQAGMA
jgi:hypothetical protein